MALNSPRDWLFDCLAPGDRRADAVREHLATGRVDWPLVLRQANRGLVVTQLAPALDRHGLLSRVPEEIRDYLTALHELNVERNRLLRRELIEATRAFNGIGVEPLLLKGSLSLLPDQPPEIAARLMGDLDLLVPIDRLADCRDALFSLGYRATSKEDRPIHHHAPPLVHADHGVKFELHRAVLGRSLDAVLPADEMWRDCRRVALEGASARAPSPTHQALHNALHTLLQDRRAEKAILELRQLLDFVQLRAREDAGIDWPLVEARFAECRQRTALIAYLLLARKLLGQPLPTGYKPALAAGWLARKFTFGARHPATSRGYHWLWRLGNLPRRLATPSWYGWKIRALWNGAPL